MTCAPVGCSAWLGVDGRIGVGFVAEKVEVEIEWYVERGDALDDRSRKVNTGRKVAVVDGARKLRRKASAALADARCVRGKECEQRLEMVVSVGTEWERTVKAP